MPIRIGAKDLLCLCLRTEFRFSSIGKESVTPNNFTRYYLCNDFQYELLFITTKHSMKTDHTDTSAHSFLT